MQGKSSVCDPGSRSCSHWPWRCCLSILGPVGPAGADDDDDDPPSADTTWPIADHGPTANDNAVLRWNEEGLQCIRVTRKRPPVVARALFITHSAVYDAWAAYDAKAVPSIRGNGNARRPSGERTPANKARAISFAAYTALYDLFPSCRGEFLQQLTALGFSTSTPAAYGRRAVQAVIDARRNDGANQAGRYADTTGTRR
jgi:uncharacterized protein DUF6851